MDKKIISIVSGGFDPIHPGHIMMMRDCLEFSNHLIVGVNSNNWLIKKDKDSLNINVLFSMLLDEVKTIWPIMGYPPLVTPYSLALLY